MPFKDEDRNMMVETHTMMREQRDDIKDLQEEDKLIHHRINNVRNMYGVIAAAVGGGMAYLKIKLGIEG